MFSLESRLSPGKSINSHWEIRLKHGFLFSHSRHSFIGVMRVEILLAHWDRFVNP